MNPSEARWSRREFLSMALAVPVVSTRMLTPLLDSAPIHKATPGISPPSPSSILDVDYPKLLARADLIYDHPPVRSEEGIPVGNGRMGSLVWTTPSAMKLEINRVDVYGNDSTTNSFFERNSDYCGGCGFVDIEFGGLGESVFPVTGFPQRLSTYDGVLEMNGNDVTARVLAWPEKDVMVVRIDDRRSAPESISIDLRMLRQSSQYFGGELETLIENHTVAVRHRNQRADSRLIIDGDRIILTQEFKEGDYLNRSAVAIRVAGRRAVPKMANEAELRLTAMPGRGNFEIFIASAASFDPDHDIAASALARLDDAVGKGYEELAGESANWWHDYWARGLIHLHSDDGVADYIEQNYNYFLYVMGASSRGVLPPKFNGMIWNTGGDLRSWGGQHWFANLSCYYEGLPTANRLELMEPAFSMYSGMYDASAAAARQQWGSEGIYIAETTWFNGLAEMPDEIAAEMRELYLLRKPWDERSERFQEFAMTKHPHSSRWNWKGGASWENGRWVETERGSGPYGPVTHILGTTAKIAYLYWRRYEYTLDRAWLADRAYPMLKGAAEFYRNYPNLGKGADGKYHINHVNSNESVWGARDTDEDISALNGILPAVIRAAEILDVDAELRRAWREFFDNLPPVPTSDLAGALKPDDYKGPRVFVRGLQPAVKGEGAFLPDRNSLPTWFFDLCQTETDDPKRLKTADATFDAFFRDGIVSDTPVSVLSKVAIAAASLGRADAVRILIPNQIKALEEERDISYRNGGVLANRMMLREGPQALDAERLGRAAEALHLALLQSFPPSPGGQPIIHVFPAWPTDWDASYTLLARGAFLVSSSMQRGVIGFVELESRAGAACRLRNPWGESAVDLYRDGSKAESLVGSLLEFATRPGERLVLVVSGDTPRAHTATVPAA